MHIKGPERNHRKGRRQRQHARPLPGHRTVTKRTRGDLAPSKEGAFLIFGVRRQSAAATALWLTAEAAHQTFTTRSWRRASTVCDRWALWPQLRAGPDEPKRGRAHACPRTP